MLVCVYVCVRACPTCSLWPLINIPMAEQKSVITSGGGGLAASRIRLKCQLNAHIITLLVYDIYVYRWPLN